MNTIEPSSTRTSVLALLSEMSGVSSRTSLIRVMDAREIIVIINIMDTIISDISVWLM